MVEAVITEIDPEEEKSIEWLKERHRHKSLAAAKIAVMAEVEYCKKQKSDGLKYPYVSESALLAVLRPSMIRHCISVTPIGIQIISEGEFTTTGGSLQRSVRVAVSYKASAVCLSNDGEESVDSQESVVISEACDGMDKACAKAMTMAMKYVLRQMFMIETGDDPDKYASQEIIQKGVSEEKEIHSAFLKFQGAIVASTEVKRLEQLRDQYCQREFSKTQLEALNKMYNARIKVLETAPATVKK